MSDQLSDQPVPETGPPKKLLCLDGGGVKGISSLMILQAIMREVARLEGDEALTNDHQLQQANATTTQTTQERRPIDYFDLIGGTSTGGIIAVMIGRLGMRCQDAIIVFDNISGDIFATRVFGINIDKIPVLNWFSKYILLVKMLIGSQFSAKYLNRNIDKVLQQYIDPDEPRAPGGQYLLVDDDRYKSPEAKGKMFMCTTSVRYGKALLFRDYTPPADAIPETKGQPGNDHELPPPAPPYPTPGCLPDDPDPLQEALFKIEYNKVTIQEAVRATSAAPTYLPPEWIQTLQFWDGGLLNNNPVDQVWSARYDLATDVHAEPYVSTVLSIGTTFSDPPKKVPQGLIARLLRTVNRTIDFATNVEAKALNFKRNIYRRNLRHPPHQQTEYFRFNAPMGKAVVDLAEYKKIGLLKRKTEEYLARKDIQRDIQRCARLLLGLPVDDVYH